MAKFKKGNWSSFILIAVLFNLILLFQYLILNLYPNDYDTMNLVPKIGNTLVRQKVNSTFNDISKPSNRANFHSKTIKDGESYILSVRKMAENISGNENNPVSINSKRSGNESNPVLINGNLPDKLEEESQGHVFMMDARQFKEVQNQVMKYQEAAGEALAKQLKNHTISIFKKTNANTTHFNKVPYLQNITIQNVKFPGNISVAKNITEEALERTYFQKRYQMVNEFTYHYVLKPGSKTCRSSTFLVILVHSKPSYQERRAAIRNSWGSVTNTGKSRWPTNQSFDVDVSLIFVTALDRNNKWNEVLQLEHEKYSDILQGDFIDDYSNMTLKSLLGLKFVSEYCSNGVQYMLKSDDDMFINLPFLIHALNITVPNRSIIGPFNGKSKVMRRGKWNLNKLQYPFSVFPPYESGSAYVITVDIVKELFETSNYVPWIFIDDVYITGILGKILNVTHLHWSKLFSYWTDKKPLPCDVLMHRKITFTKCSPQILRNLWDALKKSHTLLC